MSSEEFVVRIADLDAGPQRLQLPIRREWLSTALADVEATPWETQDPQESSGAIDLEVSKSGRQILVRGTVRSRVVLVCARTLDPAPYELAAPVFLLLSPAEETSPQRSGTPSGGARPRKRKGGWDDDPELSEEQAAEDTYSGEFLVLDSFIREFIVLEFPMFPLREDLRSDEVGASSALPSGAEATQLDRDRPLDPRLSPLAELKARLEKKE